MPRSSEGARLCLRKREGRQPVWVIRDGQTEVVAARGSGAREEAEKRLAAYLTEKHNASRNRDPDGVEIAEILKLYAERRCEEVKRFEIIGFAMEALTRYFQSASVSVLNASSCEAYRAWRCAQPRPQYRDPETAPRISASTVRRELGVLSSAVNFAYKEGILQRPVPVTMPPPGHTRERHLSRAEVASLLWGALGFESLSDGTVERHSQAISRHLCRFILIAVYTGTRHEAILRLRWTPSLDSGWIDLDHGLIYREGANERMTKKRRPPLPIPGSLLPHLRRWQRRGSASGYVIEFDGAPIKKERTAWNAARRRARLGDDVTPHVLRHTCATWLLQAGRPIWEVAGYLGATENVIREVYGHHSPDYLRGAAQAL